MYKIWSLLFTICVSTFFVACSEDDEVTITSKNDLVGTWTLKGADFDVLMNGSSYKEQLINSGMTEEQADEYLAFFTEDTYEEGTTIELKSDDKYEITYLDDQDDPDFGTWNLSSDLKKITIDEGTDDELIFDIKSFNGSNLSLFNSLAEEMDIDGDGKNDANLEVKTTINLEK